MFSFSSISTLGPLFTSERRNNEFKLQPDMTMRLPTEINDMSHDKLGFMRQTKRVLRFYLLHCSAIQVDYTIFLLWKGMVRTKMSLSLVKLEVLLQESYRESLLKSRMF